MPHKLIVATCCRSSRFNEGLVHLTCYSKYLLQWNPSFRTAWFFLRKRVEMRKQWLELSSENWNLKIMASCSFLFLHLQLLYSLALRIYGRPWCAEEWNSLFSGVLFIWSMGTLKLLKKLILPIKSHWLQHECSASTNREVHTFDGVLYCQRR